MTEEEDPMKFLGALPLLKCQYFQTEDDTPVSFCDVFDAYFKAYSVCAERLHDLYRLVDERGWDASYHFLRGFERLETAKDAYMQEFDRLRRHMEAEAKRIEGDLDRITTKTAEYKRYAHQIRRNPRLMNSGMGMRPEIKSAHYTQNFDLGERGRIECIRDDTPEEVNFHLTAWKNGIQTHAIRIRYNIMYDYKRTQNWWKGRLVEDSLTSSHCYGHLIEEGCSFGNFEDDFEPVNPFGCEMFQNQTWIEDFTLFENEVEVAFSYSPHSAYGIRRTGRIVELDILESPRDHFLLRERERIERLHYDPQKACEERLKFFREYSKWLKTNIPVDMSMVD